MAFTDYEKMIYLEIQFWKIAKWLIRKGYGANCETCDLDDFPEMYKDVTAFSSESRCASCRAKEIISWIDSHIDLLKM